MKEHLDLQQKIRQKSLLSIDGSNVGLMVAKMCVDWHRSHDGESKKTLEDLFAWIKAYSTEEQKMKKQLEPKKLIPKEISMTYANDLEAGGATEAD